MTGPWDDHNLLALVLAAEQDQAGPGADAVGEEAEAVLLEGADLDAAASGITSHIFVRRGNRAYSKSTFKPPHTTDAVWTRVAFYTGDTRRLVLSDWKNTGSGHPHRTKVQSWYFDHRSARKALVLWSMSGNTWRSWAD